MLARAIAARIDVSDKHRAVELARATNRHWRARSTSPLHDQWNRILEEEWPAIRSVLLEESEKGAQLRQNNPFCGILSPRERWEIYRKFKQHET